VNHLGQEQIERVFIQPSIADILKAVRAAILYRGLDYTYQGACSYSNNGGRSGACLFGVAFIESLGLKWEAEWEGTIDFLIAAKLKIDIFTSAQLAWLRYLQIMQDKRVPYTYVATAFNAGVIAYGWTDFVQPIDAHSIKDAHLQIVGESATKLQSLDPVTQEVTDDLDNEISIDDL